MPLHMLSPPSTSCSSRRIERQQVLFFGMTFDVACDKLTEGHDLHALLESVGKCSFDETTAHIPLFERLGHFSMGKDQGAIAPFINCDREMSVNRELITAFRRIVSNLAHGP